MRLHHSPGPDDVTLSLPYGVLYLIPALLVDCKAETILTLELILELRVHSSGRYNRRPSRKGDAGLSCPSRLLMP